MQALLAARIDRLPSDDKQLLQAASVIGTDVPLPLLRGMMELADEDFQRGLKANPTVLVRALAQSGFSELPVTAAHAARVAGLPAIHRDPFDRLLVAQSLAEPMTLLTNDAVLVGYGPLVQLV